MSKFCKLEDVCLQIIDCPHESPEWLNEGYARVIRNFNILDGQILDNEKFFVNEETYNKRTKRAVPEPGDIIFSREAPIGNCAIVPDNFKCCLGQRLVLLKIDHSKVSSEYLITVLMSNYIKYQIDQVSKRGSIVSNFNISELKELIIPVLDNQDKIAKVSNLISLKIKNNNKTIQSLESLAKTIYDYWFLQFEFPNEEGKPYKSSGGKMVWNEELKREIPDWWEIKKISEVANLYQPQTITEKDLITTGKYYVYGANGVIGNYDKYNHENNEIAICCRGASCGNFIMTLPKSWITGNSMVVSSEIKEYIYYGLSKDFIGNFITGSAQPQITRTNLENMKFIIPQKQILNHFIYKATNVRKEIEVLTLENQQLTSLRDWLLPMLMNGQVTFKDER